MESHVEEKIRYYALQNAVDHDGVANEKSVLGKVLAEFPELRKEVLNIKSSIDFVVDEINKMQKDEQKIQLDQIGFAPAERRQEKKDLPDLDVGRHVVVRFAPNPDGALHLGNARPAVLCNEYKKKYKGKFILRFDDTDPKIKVPEKRFYKWIKEDLKWMKIKWDSEIVASKRLNIYYSYAEKLVKAGHAYVCTCESESWKNLRDKGQSCQCRKIDIKTNVRKWKKMLLANTGKKSAFRAGEAVLRLKTDIEAKNPAVRDWPAFRIVDKPNHPFSRKHVWPLYNFASAIDDHLTGVTHIFRGQEHATNEVKQRYLYQYFGWKYPVTIILGRFSLVDMVLSKSEIRKGIEEGKFRGWDDLKLGTIRSLKRRGFQPEALRQIIVDVGVKPSDITISSENLASYNRKFIDRMADRYFFIPEPKKIIVDRIPIKSIKVRLHPDDKKRFRTLKISKTFFIDKNDFEKYKGLEVRLKDLCNIKLDEKSKFTGTDIKSVPKIQWVPEKHLSLRIFQPGKEINGFGEYNISKTKMGDIIQLERFGFVRIEKVSSNNIIAIFSHE